MPLRRSLRQVSAQTYRKPNNFQGIFRRFYSEQKQQKKESFTVWRPYLRLAVGVPFVGALIYSMVLPMTRTYTTCSSLTV